MTKKGMTNDIKTDFSMDFSQAAIVTGLFRWNFRPVSEALTIDFSGYSWGMFTDLVRS